MTYDEFALFPQNFHNFHSLNLFEANISSFNVLLKGNMQKMI